MKPAVPQSAGTPGRTRTPRFRARAETRMSALRVRLLLSGNFNFQKTVGLLGRMERLGRRLGAPGLTELAVTLLRTVTQTKIA